MTKYALVALWLAIASAGYAATGDPDSIQNGTGVGERVPQFTAQAVDVSVDPPKMAEFDSHKTDHITAYIFTATRCAATFFYQERLMRLVQTYGPKGVDFIYIYPNHNDDLEQEQVFHKQKKLGGRLIDDRGARLARLFKVRKTSEVYLADRGGVIRYQGAVDDSRNDEAGVHNRYVATALDEMLAGKPVTIASSAVDACPIHP